MFWVKSLSLVNFKLFELREIKFSAGINIIYGENAVGKTSIVEGVSNLLMTKSFKSTKDQDLIKRMAQYYIVSGVACNNAKDINIVVSYSNKEKKVKENNILYRKLSDYIGKYAIISFCPEDLGLITGAPKEKRRFMNTNLGQLDKEYLLALSKYNSVLKEKNEYLKKIDNSKEDEAFLDVLDNILSQEGEIIIKKREEYIEKLNVYMKKYSVLISGGLDCGKIVYNPNIKAPDYKKRLNEARKVDVFLKKSSIGPQRDTFIVEVNSENAEGYASQGQIRTEAISIKLSSAKVFKNENRNTVIILDDVFSELDDKRQQELLKLLAGHQQIFITTTDINKINLEAVKDAQLIKLERTMDNE
ncbi:MAG: DNA replication and repair protein RecF [Bacilli bacterium]